MVSTVSRWEAIQEIPFSTESTIGPTFRSQERFLSVASSLLSIPTFSRVSELLYSPLPFREGFSGLRVGIPKARDEARGNQPNVTSRGLTSYAGGLGHTALSESI